MAQGCIKKIMETILFAIIFGFIASVIFWVFHELFFATNTTVRDNLSGAFMGAFFAFLFIRFGEVLSKIYNRHAINETALIRFEHHFNDCLDRISDNISIIDIFSNLFNGYTPDTTKIRLFGNELHLLIIEKDSLFSLKNIELINDIFTLNIHLRKINDSMDTLNRMMDQTKKAFIEKQIDHATYAIHIESFKPKLEEIRKFLLAVQKDAIDILATIRVLIKDKQFLSRIIIFSMSRHFKKKQTKQIIAEKKKLIDEINSVASTDGIRIDAVRKDNY